MYEVAITVGLNGRRRPQKLVLPVPVQVALNSQGKGSSPCNTLSQVSMAKQAARQINDIWVCNLL